MRISEIVENLESIETVTPDYSLLGYRGMNYEEAETTVNKAVYEACDAIEKAVELLEESKEELQNSYGIETDLVKRINSFLKEDLVKIKKSKPVRDVPEFARKKEQPRNELCKCGSGLKYKKCCGK